MLKLLDFAGVPHPGFDGTDNPHTKPGAQATYTYPALEWQPEPAASGAFQVIQPQLIQVILSAPEQPCMWPWVPVPC